jgi:hypothetical protein
MIVPLQCPASSIVSPRPVRHVQRQASQLSDTYLPDDFSCDAWRWICLTGRGDRWRSLIVTPTVMTYHV